jgi:calcineurin-like phosphoesterase family protein
MNEIYFTSDTHFGHANIIKFVNRPFENVQEMDEGLIQNWNAVVKKNDTVYHQGDVAYWRRYDPSVVLGRLNGSIHLVLGNHDWDLLNWPLRAYPGAVDIMLLHYAMKVWNKSHVGSWHLYGHSHGSLPDDPHALSMDVGIDTHPEYRPYHLDEIREHMKTKDYVPIDGHKPPTDNKV